MTEGKAVRIAVDAMGGDHAPAEVVAGAVEAAREDGAHVLLVGDESAVVAELWVRFAPTCHTPPVPSV